MATMVRQLKARNITFRVTADEKRLIEEAAARLELGQHEFAVSQRFRTGQAAVARADHDID